MRKYSASCLAAFALLVVWADAGLAHRVNIFAFADGDAIQVECYFSKSQKVRHGKLTFSDRETNATLLEGITDEHGLFRFRPDAEFLNSGHGLHILLDAGEGHQSGWRIAPEELAALPPAGSPKPAPDIQTAPAAPPAADPEISHPVPDRAELEALIGKVLDAKLAPIKQAAARQQDSGPDMKDVIGGIGWILGLLGLATYIRYRPRRP